MLRDTRVAGEAAVMGAISPKRIPNWVIGLLLVVVLVIGSYVAFTKQLPWGGGTEVTAVFRSAQNLRPNSPVRIAGVEVGKVTSVEPPRRIRRRRVRQSGSDRRWPTARTSQGGALVKMEIDDEGLPLKEDARFELQAAPVPRGQPVRQRQSRQPLGAARGQPTTCSRRSRRRTRSSSTRC